MKFYEIKKELGNFLDKHKKFFKLKSASVYTKDRTLIYTYNTDYSNSCEKVIKLGDCIESALEIFTFTELDRSVECQWSFDEKEIDKKVKKEMKKEEISKDEVKNFLENNFLVDKNSLNTSCSSYKELSIDIQKRTDEYFCT